jgi:hypothetical protein
MSVGYGHKRGIQLTETWRRSAQFYALCMVLLRSSMHTLTVLTWVLAIALWVKGMCQQMNDLQMGIPKCWGFVRTFCFRLAPNVGEGRQHGLGVGRHKKKKSKDQERLRCKPEHRLLPGVHIPQGRNDKNQEQKDAHWAQLRLIRFFLPVAGSMMECERMSCGCFRSGPGVRPPGPSVAGARGRFTMGELVPAAGDDA